MAKAGWAWPRPWGLWPRPCGLILTLTLRLWGVANAVGHGQGVGAVAKDVVALPRSWGRGQGLGGVSKALGVWPRP